MFGPILNFFSEKKISVYATLKMQDNGKIVSEEMLANCYSVNTTISTLRTHIQQNFCTPKDLILLAVFTLVKRPRSKKSKRVKITDRNPNGSEVTIKDVMTVNRGVQCSDFDIECIVSFSPVTDSEKGIKVVQVLRFYPDDQYFLRNLSNPTEKVVVKHYPGNMTIVKLKKYIHQSYCLPEGKKFLRQVFTTVEKRSNHHLIIQDLHDDGSEVTIDDILKLTGANKTIEFFFEIEPNVFRPIYIAPAFPSDDFIVSLIFIVFMLFLVIHHFFMLCFFPVQP